MWHTYRLIGDNFCFNVEVYVMSVDLKQWDTALLFTYLQVQVGWDCFQTNKADRNYIFPSCWQWKTIFVYNRCFYQAFLQNYVFFNNSSLSTNIGNVICLRSTIQRRVRWGVINTISLVIRVKAGSQHFIQFYQPLLLDKRELLSWKL